jgi:hypothetical protein
MPNGPPANALVRRLLSATVEAVAWAGWNRIMLWGRTAVPEIHRYAIVR